MPQKTLGDVLRKCITNGYDLKNGYYFLNIGINNPQSIL
jgi:hypothetical protein